MRRSRPSPTAGRPRAPLPEHGAAVAGGGRGLRGRAVWVADAILAADLFDPVELVERFLELLVNRRTVALLKGHAPKSLRSEAQADENVSHRRIRDAADFGPAVVAQDRLHCFRQPLDVDSPVGAEVRQLPGVGIGRVPDEGEAMCGEVVLGVNETGRSIGGRGAGGLLRLFGKKSARSR